MTPTTEELQAMLAIAEKATPGDWRAWVSPDGLQTVRTVYHDDQGRRCTAWPFVCNAGAQDNAANAAYVEAIQPMVAKALLTELLASREALRVAEEALDLCGEYFDNLADADQPSGSAPIPNEEMTLGIAVDRALTTIRKARS